MSANKFDLELQTEVLEAKAGIQKLQSVNSGDTFAEFYRTANSLVGKEKPFSEKELADVAEFLQKNASKTDESEEFARFRARWLLALEKTYGTASAEYSSAKSKLASDTQKATGALQKSIENRGDKSIKNGTTTTPSMAGTPSIAPSNREIIADKTLKLSENKEIAGTEQYVQTKRGYAALLYTREGKEMGKLSRGEKVVATGVVGKMYFAEREWDTEVDGKNVSKKTDAQWWDVVEVEYTGRKYFVFQRHLSVTPIEKESMWKSAKGKAESLASSASAAVKSATSNNPTSGPSNTPNTNKNPKTQEALPKSQIEVAPKGITLSNGEVIYGLVMENGQRFFIGSKEKRIPYNVKLLPPEYQRLEIQAEGAKKVEALVDDAFTLLTVMANHAETENWSTKDSYGKRVEGFLTLLQKLDYADEAKTRDAIVNYVQGTLPPESNLGKEIRETFLRGDDDITRRKKLYRYIRGTWYNPTAKGAGFSGGSDYLADKIAARELARQGVTPVELEKMASEFLDTEWRNKKPQELADEILKKKESSSIWKAIVVAYGEKGIVSFAEKLIDTNKELEKVYNSEEANKQFNNLKVGGKTPTADEVVKFKQNSKKAKLMTLMGNEIVSAYTSSHESERKTNPGLEEYASIRGIGWTTPSDKTAMYIRNDLWKDVAIEGAAIAAGALSFGAGAVAIQAIQAGRWGVRAAHALEVISMANKAGKLASAGRFVIRNAASGAAFELGSGGIRAVGNTVIRGKELANPYSLEGFVQSAVFMGAFEGVGKVLARAGITFREGVPLLEQKATLVKLVIPDALTAMGVSFGIAKYQGENWTLEEALQAAAMAAAIRSVNGRLIARKTPKGIEVNIENNQTHRNPTTPNLEIQNRINTEHGIGRAPISAEESARYFESILWKDARINRDIFADSIRVERENNGKVSGVKGKLKKQYEAANQITSENVRLKELAKIDTMLAERRILEQNKAIEVRNEAEADAILSGLGKEKGFKNLRKYPSPDGKSWLVFKDAPEVPPATSTAAPEARSAESAETASVEAPAPGAVPPTPEVVAAAENALESATQTAAAEVASTRTLSLKTKKLVLSKVADFLKTHPDQSVQFGDVSISYSKTGRWEFVIKKGEAARLKMNQLKSTDILDGISPDEISSRILGLQKEVRSSRIAKAEGKTSFFNGFGETISARWEKYYIDAEGGIFKKGANGVKIEVPLEEMLRIAPDETLAGLLKTPLYQKNIDSIFASFKGEPMKTIWDIMSKPSNIKGTEWFIPIPGLNLGSRMAFKTGKIAWDIGRHPLITIRETIDASGWKAKTSVFAKNVLLGSSQPFEGIASIRTISTLAVVGLTINNVLKNIGEEKFTGEDPSAWGEVLGGVYEYLKLMNIDLPLSVWQSIYNLGPKPIMDLYSEEK